MRLPKDVQSRHVLLMDPISHSGRTAAAAIDYLKSEYKIPEKQIIFVSLIIARPAVNLLCQKFPNMQVVTTAIDEVNEHGQMVRN